MEGLYTTKWTKRNGSIANDLWLEALQSISDQQIKLGVDKCKERIFSGNAWAPDLAEFLAMIHGHTDVDYQAAFFRMLNKKPEGRVEQWVYENASFNIRSMAHEKAERAHKKFMLEGFEKERRGELVLAKEELLALPVNSVKNLNDIKREEFESSGVKNPFADRIKKLTESRK